MISKVVPSGSFLPLWSLQGRSFPCFSQLWVLPAALNLETHLSHLCSIIICRPPYVSVSVSLAFLKGSHLLIQTPVQPHLNLIVSAKEPVSKYSDVHRCHGLGLQRFILEDTIQPTAEPASSTAGFRSPGYVIRALSSSCSDWFFCLMDNSRPRI